MSVEAQVVERIGCTCEELLGFVMDIERYAQVDDKISPVLWHRSEPDFVEFACRPKLAGLRQPKVVQQVRLTPGERADVTLSPKPANRLAHAMAQFEASFACRPVDGGTEVTRTLRFTFKAPFRWLLEPLFQRRLDAEVRDEIARAKQHLEDR